MEVNGKKFDFSGYATKNDLPCSDGRVIRQDAFRDNDGQQVPLVWQHQHNEPSNVLGHALLENREDGVYAYGKFNTTAVAQNAKTLIEHGDITALSIYANQLKQNGKNVIHGAIREVSLVLTGANPGASIENISFAHSDGSYDIDEEEAIIYTGEDLMNESVIHADKKEEKKDNEKTVEEVFNSLTEEQKNVVYAMLAHATGGNDEVEHDDSQDDEEVLVHGEGETLMRRNVFEQEETSQATLSHGQIKAIFEDAKEIGSLKESFLAHAQEYGIENIDILFPDAKTVGEYPHLITREMDWVTGVLAGTHHTPFSRIKTVTGDLTADKARALGYVKGNLKKEEVFGLMQRVTTPTTIYKKQKLDRDDIVDITTLDVVAFLKGEMRMMLNEEIARAILVGDGRDLEVSGEPNPDKINTTHIRPVYLDDEFYTHRVQIAKELNAEEVLEAVIRARKFYKGKGTPTFYTTADEVTDMLLMKDKMGRRLYPTIAELKAVLRVKDIVEVDVMENLVHTDEDDAKFDLVGILVNLKDYTVGADKGGEINMFDDFDIDYNQYKYLMETRISGALTIPKGALVIERAQAEADTEEQ